MSNAYPSGPLTKEYDRAQLFALPHVSQLKQVAESNGVQIELTLKPTEIKMTIIKKLKDKTVKKEQFTIDNDNLADFNLKFQSAMTNVIRF